MAKGDQQILELIQSNKFILEKENLSHKFLDSELPQYRS